MNAKALTSSQPSGTVPVSKDADEGRSSTAQSKNSPARLALTKTPSRSSTTDPASGSGNLFVSEEMAKTVIEESGLVLLPTLATLIGVNQSLLLQQLNWIEDNPKMGTMAQGSKWIRNTIEMWRTNHFPFWSTDTIQRLFNALEKEGFIRSRSDMNKFRADRTKSYSIDREYLRAFLEEKTGIPQKPSAIPHECELVDIPQDCGISIRENAEPTFRENADTIGIDSTETQAETDIVIQQPATESRSVKAHRKPLTKPIPLNPPDQTEPMLTEEPSEVSEFTLEPERLPEASTRVRAAVPKATKVKPEAKANVWPEWYGANLNAGRKAPAPVPRECAAAKAMGIAFPDSNERKRLMACYLADKDAWITGQGHPLRMLLDRAGKYQNAPELPEPFEILWALWVRRRRVEEWAGVQPPVPAATDQSTMEKLVTDCKTAVEFNAAFKAYLEDMDARLHIENWPLALLPARLNRKAVMIAREETTPEKIEALRAAAREEIERMKIVVVPPVEFVPIMSDQVPY